MQRKRHSDRHLVKVGQEKDCGLGGHEMPRVIEPKTRACARACVPYNYEEYESPSGVLRCCCGARGERLPVQVPGYRASIELRFLCFVRLHCKVRVIAIVFSSLGLLLCNLSVVVSSGLDWLAVSILGLNANCLVKGSSSNATSSDWPRIQFWSCRPSCCVYAGRPSAKVPLPEIGQNVYAFIHLKISNVAVGSVIR